MRQPQVNTNLLGVLPDDDVLAQCIHCGMCLATCPTYELTKLERSSPRGRIRMIKAVGRGEMPVTGTFAYEMNFCLDCQACETACPAGVKYGSMVEAARIEVDNAKANPVVGRSIKQFALKHIVAKKKNLKLFARILYVYQNWGIQKLLHKSGILKLLSKKLAEVDKMTPRVSKRFGESMIDEITEPAGKEKYKTAFLTGCLMDVMFADINLDTVELLKNCGCRIITPKEQVCCGSLSAHNGDIETARQLAKRNLDIFNKYEFDYMISNSAGCGAFMKEYAHIFKDDPEYSETAKKFSSKVKDITEFLNEAELDVELKSLDDNITYHDACHLAHTQEIVNQPREVINKIPGLKYTPLEESTWCCGSAGIYNIVQYDTSMKILERKMNNIKNTGAKVVLAGNPGCIRQIQYGAEKFNVDVEVKHPVSLFKKVFISK